MDGILVARADFFYSDANGAPHHVRKGDMFRPGHPILTGREELFEDVASHVDHDEHLEAAGSKRVAPKLKLGGGS